MEWEYYKYNAGLFGQKTEYMGQPTNKTNDLWLDIVEREWLGKKEQKEGEIQRLTSPRRHGCNSGGRGFEGPQGVN